MSFDNNKILPNTIQLPVLPSPELPPGNTLYIPLYFYWMRIYEIVCNVYPDLPRHCQVDIAYQVTMHSELDTMMDDIYNKRRWRAYFRSLGMNLEF